MSSLLTSLQHHFDYTAWASARMVDAAASLTADELTRDFATADRSVLGTLVHVFAADRVWLGRITGNLHAAFFDAERDLHLSILQNEWPTVLDKWREMASGWTDDSVAAEISYKDLKGNPHVTPLWQIGLHVVNHGTRHRGQAAGFIRAMGYTPPPLDLIAYYRQLK